MFLLISTFAPMNENQWTENVIIADADFVDKVVFDLTVNFERMLERQIPQADLARWTECVALDGGLRNGDHQTTVALIHNKERTRMDNIVPGNYDDLNGKAFQGPLGEFLISAISTEGLATKEDLLLDTLQICCSQKEVKRVMVIPDDYIYNKVREMLRQVDDDDKRITVFAMAPQQGGNFRQEILGYSLMAALGIRGEEIRGKSEE